MEKQPDRDGFHHFWGNDFSDSISRVSPPTDKSITVLGKTNFRNQGRIFGIRPPDRLFHAYAIGKTGTGKSTLLSRMILSDLERGAGLAVIEPHGDLIEEVLARFPEKRKNDLTYFNVPDESRVLGFNPLESVPKSKRPLAASGILEAFKKFWNDSWGPRLEHIMRNALLVLFDQPQATLADIARLLDDRDFRRNCAGRAHNPHVRNFWLREYESYPVRLRADAIAPLQNKVGAFLANPFLYPILAHPVSAFDLRKIMDEGKVLLVNLAKGKIGEDTAALLGGLLIARISLAALSRADLAERARRDFYLYLDEFQTFPTTIIANMMSELRKYHCGVMLSNQFLFQLDPQVKSAILGNTGTLICFRVGLEDALTLEKEFYPVFQAEDLVRLPNYHIYLKLMVDGKPTEPFSAMTLPPQI